MLCPIIMCTLDVTVTWRTSVDFWQDIYMNICTNAKTNDSHNNIVFGKYENMFLFFKKPLNYVLLLDNISSFCVCKITHKSFNVHFAHFLSLIATTARF